MKATSRASFCLGTPPCEGKKIDSMPRSRNTKGRDGVRPAQAVGADLQANVAWEDRELINRPDHSRICGFLHSIEAVSHKPGHGQIDAEAEGSDNAPKARLARRKRAMRQSAFGEYEGQKVEQGLNCVTALATLEQPAPSEVTLGVTSAVGLRQQLFPRSDPSSDS